jgi:hypothetical protein
MRKMKNTFVTLGLSCVLAIGCSGVYAQAGIAPPGASDKNLENRDIKGRSVELERIRRDADKANQNAQPQQIPKEKFEEIKQDFENIQRLQSEIINAYTMSKQINYAKISDDAGQMNKSSLRLESNLFPVVDKKDKKKSKEKTVAELPLPQDIKGLIVELDNTLAAFVGNAMFTNPQVVNSADHAKAQADIEKIIRLSAALNQEAEKATKH